MKDFINETKENGFCALGSGLYLETGFSARMILEGIYQVKDTDIVMTDDYDNSSLDLGTLNTSEEVLRELRNMIPTWLTKEDFDEAIADFCEDGNIDLSVIDDVSIEALRKWDSKCNNNNLSCILAYAFLETVGDLYVFFEE